MKIDINTAARLIAREQCRRMAAERKLRTVRAALIGTIERADNPEVDQPDEYDEAELFSLACNRLTTAVTLDMEAHQ
jgi:hypothetical protein